jgi:ABC-type bacteriocin/lantibiotic exporter with double-glycine peptidase domain
MGPDDKLAQLAKPRWLVPEVVQTSAMDCGPASLKCLLEGFGIGVSYGRLREACQTDLDGTSIDTIEVIANQLGLNAEQVMVPVDHLFLSEAQLLPAIVVVRNPDGSTHFVVVWRRHGGWLQVMDPAVGRRWVPCRRFAEEVFRHELSALASDWRDWAGTEDFLRPLRQQLAAIGASEQDTATLVDRALKNPYWFGLALVDASVRFIKSVIDAGGLQAGPQSVKLATTLFEQTRENIQHMFKIIPAIYWSVVPDKPVPGEEMALLLRGAVVLRVAGKKTAGLEAQVNDEKEASEEAEETAPRSLELIAALSEKPLNPLKKIWDLLLLDGLLGPVALTVAIVVAAAVVLIELLLFKGLFDITGTLALPGQRIAALLALMALVGLLMLIEVPIFTETLRYGRQLETRLRMALLRKLPHLNDRYFQSRPVSDMAERGHSIVLTRGVPGLGLQFIQTLCDLSFTLVGIALIDRASLLPAVLLAGVALCIPLLVQPFLNERDLRVRNHSGALHVFYLDALLGLVPIRTHRAEQAVRRQHEGLLVEWARSSRGLIGIVLTTDAVQALLCLGFAGYLLGEHLLRSGGVTGGDLLLIYWTLKLPALGHAFTSLAQQYPAQRNVLLRLLEPLAAPTESGVLADAAPDIDAAPVATQKLEIAPGALAIRIENGKVLASGHTLLQDVDLSIAAGEHIAIVGLSGAGKSTLLGLLLGWHRLAAGELQVDGARMTAAAQEQLRRATAWVDPAIQIWNRPLLDNLNFASDSEHFEQIGDVLKSADLRGVLQKLPEGLQTYLGEGGALLSGGEGQRVRLARALMQTGVRLALLDEPFRGVDRTQRARLLAQARGWWKDATLLCVTHDVAETLSFGRVLVVEGGRIVEDGAPAQLAASASRYRELLDAEKQVRERLWEGKHWRHIQIENGSIAATKTETAAPVIALVAAQAAQSVQAAVRALP